MRNRLFLALVFTSGVFLVQQLASLPSWVWIALAWLSIPSLFFRGRLVFAVFMLGIAWALSLAVWRMQDRLTSALEGKDMAVSGVIASLPEPFSHGWRFEFAPEAAAGLPSRLRLSWYDPRVRLKAGEAWRLRLRLKRPHGSLNPGGFDYERWLYARGIGATGYVRPATENARLSTGHPVDPRRWRQVLADEVGAALNGRPFSGMVRALVMGDESGIGPEQWRVLRATGTVHLVAISGSHIGLVAALVFFLVRKTAARFGIMRVSPPSLGAVAALLAALCYTALADFAIPARRAFFMASAVLGAVLWRRHARACDVLALALLLVVATDPLAVLAPGFWLSFIAVALILLAVAGRLRPITGWRAFIRANWSTSLGLAPLLLLLFQQVPWVTPLANAFAIPVMGTLAVPLSLCGAAGLLLGIDAHGYLLLGAEQLLQWCWPVLQWFSRWPRAEWARPTPPEWSLALAGLAAVLCLLPRGLAMRWLALPLLLPALTWRSIQPAEGAYELTVLDVGQGLAVVARTAGHVLVYDTGPKSGEEMDSGRNVVEPFLRAVAGGAVDTLVVSHGDNDHIGGATYLLDNLPYERLYTSVPDRLEKYHPLSCLAGQAWRWDGVEFSILSPWDESGSENNRSCVLKITGRNGNALLTGDIEREAETRLLQVYGRQLASDVLVVPHHGSRTSSTLGFLGAVQPRLALFPAGYRNRYQFPSQEILDRYHGKGIETEISGFSGAVTVSMEGKGARLTRYRDLAGKYWHWRP